MNAPLNRSADPTNPYAASVSEPAAGSDPSDAEVSVTDFGPIIRSWEFLRLIYNAVLILWTLGLTVLFEPSLMARVDYWFVVVVSGAIANLCFLIGPAVEGYARRFGFWHPAVTGGVFLLGLLFAMALAAMTVAGLSF